MKAIQDLSFGFSDAENYKRRENKTLFSRLFIRTPALDKLVCNQTFFLVGEKGTGKTAYAVYLENCDYNNTRGRIAYMRETEYQSFISLKREKHLLLSDYAGIWKVILLVLLAKEIRDKDVQLGLVSKYVLLQQLRDAIDAFYNRAFSPEIVNVFRFLHEEELAVEFLKDIAKLKGAQKASVDYTENRFQTNLLFIEKQFREAFLGLRLEKNIIVFIDGIDIRPSNIPFDEYHACVKGLANAIWALNNDLFPKLKDSNARLKVVLLVRPDIFASLGLHNPNAKLHDNSVLLDWRTTTASYRHSELFRVVDRVLSSQQDSMHEVGVCWDHYFPFKMQSTNNDDSSFIGLLKNSLYRPRDMITMLSILRDLFIEKEQGRDTVFSLKDFESSDFQNRYSEYLLGEIKDHLSFYYSDLDYESFRKFFEFLSDSLKFSYEEFCQAFRSFREFCGKNKKVVPVFCETADAFLQCLYDLNVISYTEQTDEGAWFRLCLRERSYSNLSPKVKTHEQYQIFYGLSRALNLGKKKLARKDH